MSIYQLTFCFTHKLKRRHPCRLWWGFLRKCWLCTSSKVKSLGWHDEVQIICITWKIVVLTLDCNQNLSLCFLWRFWPSFVNVKSSMIYMTKMQITAFQEYAKYFVIISSTIFYMKREVTLRILFSTWYDQIYCLKLAIKIMI